MYSIIPREWTILPASQRVDIDDFIRMMHFNVLADELTGDGSFMNTNKEDLQWKIRCLRLLEVICLEEPDILSLVECDHYEDFWVPELAKMGLTGSKKVIKDKFEKTHGVVLFVKESRFKINGVNEITDGVAILAFSLLDIQTKRMFVVVTTHLKAKKHPEIRISQLTKIVKMCRPLIDFGVPLILTGDFNTDLSEDSMKFAMLELELEAPVDLLWTTWKSRMPSSWQPGGETKKSIDHFLISDSIVPTAYLCQPNDEIVQKAGLLPGSGYPSDHLAIVMDFLIDN